MFNRVIDAVAAVCFLLHRVSVVVSVGMFLLKFLTEPNDLIPVNNQTTWMRVCVSIWKCLKRTSPDHCSGSAA